MNYGFSYQGSKNRLAERIVEELPPAEYFVDLFAGGGAKRIRTQKQSR